MRFKNDMVLPRGLVYVDPSRSIFDDEGLAMKLMALIHFLSDIAKETVLDHITFFFIWEKLIEACLNLYDDLTAPVLTENMST